MKVILVGALGRMGGHVRALLDKAGYTTIPVDAFSQGDEALKSINDVTVSADVIIDFSFHTLTEEVVDYIRM